MCRWTVCLRQDLTSLASPAPRPSGGVTAREVAVIRALQQGKSNKVIAYELNMCESTVKVHVRNLMKKMKAKNRTDLAIKDADPHSCQRLDGGLEEAGRMSGCRQAGRAARLRCA